MEEVGIGQQIEIEEREKSLEETTEESCFVLIDKKTSAYTCDLPAGYGAIIAGLDDEQVSKVRQAFRKLGLPFQIIDDYLNLASEPNPDDKYGKFFADDILEGKRTLAAIWTEQRAKGEDKERHRQLYGKKDASIEEKREWIAIANKYGVLEDMRKLAEEKMNEAVNEVEKLLPDNSARQEMLGLLKFFVKRKY